MIDGVKLAGLWEKKDKNGNPYLTGALNYSNRVLIMKNNFKEKDEEPDYFLHITPIKKEKKKDDDF